jgi:hypothetical protein
MVHRMDAQQRRSAQHLNRVVIRICGIPEMVRHG